MREKDHVVNSRHERRVSRKPRVRLEIRRVPKIRLNADQGVWHRNRYVARPHIEQLARRSARCHEPLVGNICSKTTYLAIPTAKAVEQDNALSNGSGWRGGERSHKLVYVLTDTGQREADRPTIDCDRSVS
jgi:hypothetical protein